MKDLLVDERALTQNHLGRHARCGAPYVGIHESGKTGVYAMGCGLRWCLSCAKRYGQRAFRLIQKALTSTGLDKVYMVTLTRRADPGDDVEALTRAVERDRAHWRHTTRRLRYDDARLAKLRQAKNGAARRRAWRRLQDGAIRPADVTWAESSDVKKFTCYDDDNRYWRDIPDDRAYLWAFECTYNQRRRWWHAHRHIVVRSRSEAERLVAAAASHSDPIQGETPYRVDIQEWDTDRAVGYVSSYMSGCHKTKDGDWSGVASSLPLAQQQAYVEGMQHVRRYDAGGDWRPLGMAREPSDDPMIGAAFGAAAVPSQQFFRQSYRELPKQRAAGDEHQNTNNSGNLDGGRPGSTENPCTTYEQSADNVREERCGEAWIGLWERAKIPEKHLRRLKLCHRWGLNSAITLSEAYGQDPPRPPARLTFWRRTSLDATFPVVYKPLSPAANPAPVLDQCAGAGPLIRQGAGLVMTYTAGEGWNAKQNRN